MPSALEQRIFEIENKITMAAKASGRQRADVQLVAVSKTWPAAAVREAYKLGLRNFGENYVQEALEKKQQLRDLDINWHFIGHLQSNKVKNIVGEFALIHSVDRLKIANEISGRTMSAQKPAQEILLEVNIGNEASKDGVAMAELPRLLDQVQSLEGIVVRGLMVMPPLSWQEEELKRAFAQLRDERDRLSSQVSAPHNLLELSMGTSHDYVAAIEAGATIVRLGTVIFGKRQ